MHKCKCKSLNHHNISTNHYITISQIITLPNHYITDSSKFITKSSQYCISLNHKKGHMWQSLTHTQNLCSAFNPSKSTHTVNTHPGAVGSQWGADGDPVPCSKGLISVMVLKVERTLVIHSLHRQFLPDPRFKPTTSGYKSDALSIRP